MDRDGRSPDLGVTVGQVRYRKTFLIWDSVMCNWVTGVHRRPSPGPQCNLHMQRQGSHTAGRHNCSTFYFYSPWRLSLSRSVDKDQGRDEINKYCKLKDVEVYIKDVFFFILRFFCSDSGRKRGVGRNAFLVIKCFCL